MLISLLLYIFTFVEFNCENLFDHHHDDGKQDEAFTPEGLYRWTPYRYWQKINHIGQEIVSCSHSKNGSVSLPDVVALCEVENDSVLYDLTHRSMLREAGYEYIITHSPDVRGIDVALLYNPLSFSLIHSHAIRIEPYEGMRPTRDILYAKGQTAAKDTMHIFVVHAPSKAGGEINTRDYRMKVTTTLAHAVDSLQMVTANPTIIIAGDFNDPPKAKSLSPLTAKGMINISANSMGKNGASGTYKYQGEWEHIDHVLTTSDLSTPAEVTIHDIPPILTADDDYGGIRPKRNIERAAWMNGFSDHLPIIVRWDIKHE